MVNRPTVFIGSSRESINILKEVQRQLQSRVQVKVIPWDDPNFFRAGDITIDKLVESVPEFDFAIMIFGFDDIVISRGQELAAPRDNVIFELGLFMSYLKRKRALVVAPRASNKRLKILSDLSGLYLAQYDQPSDAIGLEIALQPAVDQIVQIIKDLGARLTQEPVALPGPRDVLSVGQSLEDLLTASMSESRHTRVQNIALDMEITWQIAKDRILTNTSVQGLAYDCLMINPDDPNVQSISSDTVSPDTARIRISQIQKECERLKNQLRRRGIHFECRAYRIFPPVHGFMINERQLLLTVCGNAGGKLIGHPNPYWRLDKEPGYPASNHFFDVFQGWFDYLWQDVVFTR